MARLNPPSSTAVVDVPDALVEQYRAQGWRDADSAPDGAPRGNASLEEWAAYAIAQGVPGDALDGLKRDEIKQLLAE